MTAQTAYYWAGGQRVPLASSPEVLLDLGMAADAGLDPAEIALLERTGNPVTRRLVMVAEESIPRALRSKLADARGVHPVFRAEDGTLLAVLPEVRVEASDPRTFAQLRDLLAKDPDAIVKEQRPGRLSVEPASGRGADALVLANRLTETADPDLAQARFLRMVARPDRHSSR